MNNKIVRLDNIHYWVVLFLILYTSDSIYTCVYYKLDNFMEIATEVLMLLFVVYIRKKQMYNALLYMVCIMTVMLLLSLTHVENTEYAYLMLIVVRIGSTLIFALGCIQLKRDFYRDISSLIYYIAVFGIICYLIFEINPFGLTPSMSLVHVSSGDHRVLTKYINFFNIYYRWDTRIHRILGLRLVRENAFFREVGVYAIFLNFALIYYLFLDNKINKKRIVVLSVSILLAQSTMGLLVMIIAFAFKFINSNYKLMIIAMPLVIVLGYVFFVIVADKFEGGVKIASRYHNLMNAISLIISSPIFGAGCHRKYLSWFGLMNYFVFFGIAGLYPVYVVVKGLIRSKKGLGFFIAFFSWYFLSLMNETAGYNLFFLSIYPLMSFSGMIYKEKQNDNQRRIKLQYRPNCRITSGV